MTAKLETLTASEIMDMPLPPGDFVVEKLLSSGVNILAGSPKVGKSWLMLWLADRISQGKPVWSFPCKQSDVLYFALEDSQRRLQNRLNAVTGGETGTIYIATHAPQLGKGFEDQLSAFLDEHWNVKFVIIDTLQMIRPSSSEGYSYQADYADMRALKDIADKYDITILAVHHTRKKDSDDAFNMISGTTGIIGCADGALVLQKENRAVKKHPLPSPAGMLKIWYWSLSLILQALYGSLLTLQASCLNFGTIRFCSRFQSLYAAAVNGLEQRRSLPRYSEQRLLQMCLPEGSTMHTTVWISSTASTVLSAVTRKDGRLY